MLGGAKKRRPCSPCCPGGPSREGQHATARWLPTRRPARAPLPRRACLSHDIARGTLTTVLRGAQRGFRTPRDGDLVLPRTSSAVKPARARSSAPSRQSGKGVQSKRWSVRGTATVELFARVLNAAVCSAAGQASIRSADGSRSIRRSSTVTRSLPSPTAAHGPATYGS
jgi:hypothetical protein